MFDSILKVIVFGATGGTGRALLDQALGAGHDVTAFVRDPAALDGLDARIRVIAGDALEASSVADAVAGHDAVLSALGTRPWRHVDICSGGIRSIVPAMRGAGIRRVVALSSLGVGDSWSQMSTAMRIGSRLLLSRAFRDKAAMEHQLRETDLEWVIPRPALLTDGKPRGVWRAADDGSIHGGKIARADVAAFMLAQLSSDTWLRKLPVLAY
jgi:putative NADH-flavin reductase